MGLTIARVCALTARSWGSRRQVADDICGVLDRRPIPTALATAIVRIGPMTVASTGANRRALADALDPAAGSVGWDTPQRFTSAGPVTS